MTPSLLQSLVIGVFGAVVGAYLSNRFARSRSHEQNVYVPVFNEVQEVLNTLDYDASKGEFQKIWEPLDGHVKRGVDDEITGPLVMYDGNVSELNRFLTNYTIVLKHRTSESEFITEHGGEYRFVIGEEIEIPVDEFVNRFGETIIATSEKTDLWERLWRNAERGQYYSEIKDWEPWGGRIDLLWDTRERTYKESPHMVKPPNEIYSESIDYVRMADETLKSKIDYIE